MNKVLVAAVLLAAPMLASAGNADAGKTKAAVCAGCHGANGVSIMPMYPNLAGQKEQYLVKQLKDLRDGRRNDPVMSSMAKPLSDADIDDLAAYFSAMPAAK